MRTNDDLLAVILAGGRGERLSPLTRDRAKPAVPFGGAYRIIDFTLSNCYNSGIRKILLLTQYKAMSLDRHIASGWSRLFCRDFGEFIDIVPPQQRIDASWYQGTANAVYQNIYSIEKERPDHVLILAGDHIYRMNYGRLLAFHRERGADLTIAAIPVPSTVARGQFGVLSIDASKRVVGFEEKPDAPEEIPERPGMALASMGIYLFNAGFLFEELCRDATIRESRHDFGKNLIPRLIEGNRVFAYEFRQGESDPLPVTVGGREDGNGTKETIREEKRGGEPYWRDVGTLESYYDANMDLVNIEPRLNLYDPLWPTWTRQTAYPPPKFVFSIDERKGEAVDSLVCPGSIISGASVRHSILGHSVRVNSFSIVEDSILFAQVKIGRNARVRRAILDKGVTIPEGWKVGFDPDLDRRRGFFVSPTGITVVPKLVLGESSF